MIDNNDLYEKTKFSVDRFEKSANVLHQEVLKLKIAIEIMKEHVLKKPKSGK